MELYRDTENYKLYNGSVIDICSVIDIGSVDCIITDPPYELNFMGRDWDNAGVSFNKYTWEQCLKVLKPGGYLLAFGGTRTYHRIACAIEDAGFEIRDCIMWLYGSGFPKSMNVGLAIDNKNGVESKVVGISSGTVPDMRDIGEKQKSIIGINKLSFGQMENANRKYVEVKEAQNEWNGWGTCLKPAYEPIIVARKPFNGNLVDNIIENGVGALNIDECRIAFEGDKWKPQKSGVSSRAFQSLETTTAGGECVANDLGRFPANVILTYNDEDKEEVCGGMPDSKGASSQNNYSNGKIYRGQSLNESSTKLNGYREWYNDSGSASRYFYCAKATPKDREEGLDYVTDDSTNRKNTHPTVKPTELMQYLIRLVAPQNSIILDPFMGSGSTGKAVMFENRENHKNYKFIGVELNRDYVSLANSRIHYAMDFTYDYEKLKEENVKVEPKRELYKLF